MNTSRPLEVQVREIQQQAGNRQCFDCRAKVRSSTHHPTHPRA